MKNKDILIFILSSMLLASMTGKSARGFLAFLEPASLEDRGLKVSAKVYTPAESRQVLRINLSTKGYVPVEITIHNSTHHTYAISRASTALKSAQPKEIAWKVTKGSIPRGIGLKVLSLVFWPMNVVSSIDSIFTFKKHRSILKILSAKGFKTKEEIVLPYSMVKRLLYVPKDLFYSDFSVALEDKTAEELVVIPVKIS
jgi:hypothetical protein